MACLVSACSSDTPDEVEVSKGAEMSFAVADRSRATVTTSFDEFTVYSDLKDPENETANPVVQFDKTQVVYRDNEWSYDVKQYWYPQHEHSFVAISPSSVLDNGATPLYSNSRLSFTYTIPTTAGILNKKDDVSDIITATHRRFYDKDKYFFIADSVSKIILKFDHILSMVNFAPELNDDFLHDDGYVTFHKLEFSGFKTKATINILPASRSSNNETDDRVVSVTGQEGDAKYTVEFTNPKIVTNNKEKVSLFENNDALIMLPQVFASDSQAKIILTYTINDDTQPKQLTVALKNITWQTGMSYTCVIPFTIDKSELTIGTTGILDWETEQITTIKASSE